jgi:hypothetical protein
LEFLLPTIQIFCAARLHSEPQWRYSKDISEPTCIRNPQVDLDVYVVSSKNSPNHSYLGVLEGVKNMAKPRVPKKVSDHTSVPAAEAASSEISAANGNDAVIKTQATQNSRKPVIVRSEARPNVVPINLEDEIRRLAYLLSERRGFEPGHEAEDWLTAEREVRQRYHQQSA